MAAAKKSRLNNLDALRIIAALAVCFFHFNWSDGSLISQLFSFGYLGVNVFFCISGFITPMVLEWTKFTYPDSGKFLLSRFFRLYPAFAIIALLEIILYATGAGFMGYSQQLESITWARTFTNFTLSADFLGERWYVPIFWTMAIEAQFAIAIIVSFPLFVSRHRLIRLSTFLLWALAPLLVGSGSTLLSYSAVYALGIAVFLRKTKRISSVEFLLLLGIAFYGDFHGHSHRAAYTALGTALIVAFAPELRAKWPAKWGTLAYSFFLIHITFGGAVMFQLHMLPKTWHYQLPAVLLAALVSTLAASTFYKWIESPFHNYARKLKNKGS